jgi:hypothetical protein
MQADAINDAEVMQVIRRRYYGHRVRKQLSAAMTAREGSSKLVRSERGPAASEDENSFNVACECQDQFHSGKSDCHMGGSIPTLFPRLGVSLPALGKKQAPPLPPPLFALFSFPSPLQY